MEVMFAMLKEPFSQPQRVTKMLHHCLSTASITWVLLIIRFLRPHLRCQGTIVSPPTLMDFHMHALISNKFCMSLQTVYLSLVPGTSLTFQNVSDTLALKKGGKTVSILRTSLKRRKTKNKNKKPPVATTPFNGKDILFIAFSKLMGTNNFDTFGMRKNME